MSWMFEFFDAFSWHSKISPTTATGGVNESPFTLHRTGVFPCTAPCNVILFPPWLEADTVIVSPKQQESLLSESWLCSTWIPASLERAGALTKLASWPWPLNKPTVIALVRKRPFFSISPPFVTNWTLTNGWGVSKALAILAKFSHKPINGRFSGLKTAWRVGALTFRKYWNWDFGFILKI